MKRRRSNFFMPEGYCVKCKAKKEIVDAVEETMKNGRKAIKGKCPTCGTVMFKILGGKASPAADSRRTESKPEESRQAEVKSDAPSAAPTTPKAN